MYQFSGTAVTNQQSCLQETKCSCGGQKSEMGVTKLKSRQQQGYILFAQFIPAYGGHVQS